MVQIKLHNSQDREELQALMGNINYLGNQDNQEQPDNQANLANQVNRGRIVLTDSLKYLAN